MSVAVKSSYIYLLQEREFVKTKENIYKVGMTEKENYERFNQYPKGSVLLFQMICNDCKKIEKQVIKLFKENMTQRKDIGNEYFEGNYKTMINIIHKTINDENAECNMNNEEEIMDQEDEQEEEQEYYEITTYEEWIKYNELNIVITNKKGEGYIRFDQQLWRKIYDKNSFDFDESCMEYLSGFVEHYQPELKKMISPTNDLIKVDEMVNLVYKYKNKLTNEIINNEEYSKLSDDEKELYSSAKQNMYKFINVKYDVDKIVQDTIRKRLTKSFDFYELKYNEYVFSVHSNLSRSQYVILNAADFTFTPVDNIISNKILTSNHSGGKVVYVKNTANIDIVDDIINTLIEDKYLICQYKKLVYNLLVEYTEKQIFYDYDACIFTTWITDVLYAISGDKLYIYSSDYYENKSEINKLIKTNKYRCVIIEKYKNISLEKQTKHFSKLGFKNIIVCNRQINKLYKTDNLKKYLYNNKSTIIKCVKEENNNEFDETRYEYDGYIFYRSDLLFTNFLKWCCSK